MKNTQTPTVTTTIDNKWPIIRWADWAKAWAVDARTKYGGARRYFKNKQEAIGWAEAQRIQRENEGNGAFDNRDLAKFGLTVTDAIKFTLEHYRRQAASVRIEEAIDRLLDSKRAARRSESYLALVELNLRKVARHFAGRMISTITTDELERFIGELTIAPETWNTIRRDCVTLWSYAVKMKLAPENVAKAIERAQSIDSPPIILTPEQTAALLLASSDDLLAFHAIGCFAGLRTIEIKRLDWQNVDFVGGHIEVSTAKSKTRRRRLVPLLDNLRAWLQPIAKAAGPIVGPNLRRRRRAAQHCAGIKQWPKNCMRHSFVSYRLAAIQNLAQVELECDHDEDVLFMHYRELVRPKDAERYFSIFPPSSTEQEKIVSITAA
jgi:integrase